MSPSVKNMRAEINFDKKKFSLGVAPSTTSLPQNITNSQKTLDKKISEKLFFGSGDGTLKKNQSK